MNTPTLEQALEIAQQLSFEDQRALIALLQPPKTIEEMAAEQGIGPFNFDEAWREAEGLWPESETADEFDATIREWRNEGVMRELH